ncbi:MAG: hydrogenase maturation protease [Desulfobacteraceae bacterium]|nr:hydrogenase maturation protease [Desulfobacteraceae bacterium]
MKTVVIGLGNPILTDDGVGVKAARLLTARLQEREEVDVLELHAGGLRLLDGMAGYQRAFLIDATVAGDCPPGTVRALTLAECGRTRNMACSHDTALLPALAMGDLLGCPLPAEIRIWGVEAADVETFGEELTPPVAAALPEVVELVMAALAAEPMGRSSMAGARERQ